MDHKLHVLVRIDMDCASAVIRIAGCLTDNSCTALFPLIRRLQGLSRGLTVTVDLSEAKHIDSRGVETLRLFSSGQPVDTATPDATFTGALHITVPEDLPQCPASTVRQRVSGVAA